MMIPWNEFFDIVIAIGQYVAIVGFVSVAICVVSRIASKVLGV